MNLVYFLSYFPKLSESFILNEIYELERKGHTVAVCALNNPENRIVHQEVEKLDAPIQYIERPTYSDITELLSTKAIHSRVLGDIRHYPTLKQHAANLVRAKKCIEFIETIEWSPDQFHTHFAYASKFAARYASDYYDVPFTITAHAADLYQEPIGTYTKRLLGSADRIITISEYNKRYIHNQFTQETPIDIVRAGIRPEKFSPTNTTIENRVVTTARLVEIKGFPYALEAVKIVTERIPDIEYHIVGSGELKPNLVRTVDRLGIEDNVTFLDAVSDRRLVTELDEARCFLLPCVVGKSGNRDGIPVALMEAMAMKTPPVSTTVSGIPELIDHRRNGLLTKPRDTESTADALLELLQNDAVRATYAEQARKKVSTEFNIENEADKLESAFREVQKAKIDRIGDSPITYDTSATTAVKNPAHPRTTMQTSGPSNRSILVTGGAGFIGSHLTNTLIENNTVTVLDALTTGDESNVPEEATLVEGDVRDETALEEAIADVDIVFHEAALVSVGRSIEAPTESHSTTATGTLNVLEAARKTDTRVVLASSAAIYGHPEYTPIDESHPKTPTSPYGLDKLAADHYARLYHEHYGLETVSLRYFNVYGPGQTGGDYAGVISVFIEQALNGDPITVHGTGEQTRDFVFVEDIIQANLLAAETDRVGTAYNVGTGASITVRKLAELIREGTDSDSEIIHTEPRAGDIQHSEADIGRIRDGLGYAPTVSLREGLERTIEWYESS